MYAVLTLDETFTVKIEFYVALGDESFLMHHAARQGIDFSDASAILARSREAINNVGIYDVRDSEGRQIGMEIIE